MDSDPKRQFNNSIDLMTGVCHDLTYSTPQLDPWNGYAAHQCWFHNHYY